MRRQDQVIVALAVLAATCVGLELGTDVEALQIGAFVGAIGAAALLVSPSFLAWHDIRERSKPIVWFDLKPKLQEDARNNDIKVITLFLNEASFPADFRVYLDFTMYGKPVAKDSVKQSYSGRKTILVPPKGMHGNFSFKDLLAANGTSIEKMKKQTQDANRSTQLAVSIRLEYRRTGSSRWEADLPETAYYFDFKDMVWVYDATK